MVSLIVRTSAGADLYRSFALDVRPRFTLDAPSRAGCEELPRVVYNINGMSTRRERSAGRTAYLLVRTAVVALVVWYLAVGVVSVIEVGADAVGAAWLVTSTAGVVLTTFVALSIAGAVVFAVFTYWYYRGGLLGVTQGPEHE
jgi:hypothetical protein